ncbi:MAG: hypothetical protein HY914_08560 [Desulfomonile tiedjei]|nr:hypothetical protein [Desulfomonile tiedjei]
MVRDASALGGTKEWFTGSLERPGARVITHDVDRYESVDVDPQEGTRFGTYVDVRLKAHRRQVTPK